MKKLLPVIFFLWFSNTVFAQKIHFADTSNVWKEVIAMDDEPLPPTFNYGVALYTGDTMIASIQYEILGADLIREDTILKKVYIRAHSGDSDIVMLDYNLNVGDTFTTAYDTIAHVYYQYAVLGIDSTLINGVWHRVWNFSHQIGGFLTDEPPIVIEGIGCIQGSGYMFMLADGVEPAVFRMYCFSNKSTTPPLLPPVSFLDNVGSCSYYATLQANQLQLNEDEITIFPNPATTTLTIQSTSNINELTITNLLGQVMTSPRPSPKEREVLFVDVSGWPSGVYFVKVNGVVRKFVKE